MPANPIVTCSTTAGDFECELFLDKMPITVSNIVDLCNTGFYNGVHFHRVIEGFMLQFGCPYAKDAKSSRAGTGGPAPGSTFKNLVTGETIARDRREGCIPDEMIDKTTNDVGTLSMANTGAPNSGGSQFFVNTVHNDFLDWWRHDLSESQHVVFGKVVKGFDVVKKIEAMPCDRNDNPKTPVMMKSMKVA